VASFLNPVLGTLDRILGIRSAQKSTSKVDVENGLSLVFDVSRLASLGTGIGPDTGLVMAVQEVTTVGADDTFVDVDLFATFDTNVPANFWAWALRAWAWVGKNDVADMTAISITHEIPTGTLQGMTGALRTIWPVYGWAAGDAEVLSNFHGLNLWDSNLINQVTALPVLLPPGGTVRFNYDVGGAMTVQFAVLYWFGSKNTFPPGFA